MNEEKIPTLDDKYTMTDKLSTCWHHDPSTKGWFDTAGEKAHVIRLYPMDNNKEG